MKGFKYHFIHKSVVEFHAASFISHAAEETAQKFYSKLEGGKWPKWQEELRFLSQIDRYRYLKYFYIPSLKAALLDAGVDLNQSVATIQVSIVEGLKAFDTIATHFVDGSETNVPQMSFSIGDFGAEVGFVAHNLQMSYLAA